MKQHLYTWNWIGGGYNQAYAWNKADALIEAKRIWPAGIVDETSLRIVRDEASYWRQWAMQAA